jgi:hypothetical protein
MPVTSQGRSQIGKSWHGSLAPTKMYPQMCAIPYTLQQVRPCTLHLCHALCVPELGLPAAAAAAAAAAPVLPPPLLRCAARAASYSKPGRRRAASAALAACRLASSAVKLPSSINLLLGCTPAGCNGQCCVGQNSELGQCMLCLLCAGSVLHQAVKHKSVAGHREGVARGVCLHASGFNW